MKSTGAPQGDELGVINPLLRSSCSFLYSSCIFDGAKRYGTLATVAAPDTRLIWNSTIQVEGVQTNLPERPRFVEHRVTVIGFQDSFLGMDIKEMDKNKGKADKTEHGNE
ncbi:hypothetical protein Tco_1050243 [Tanacetum coccineum]